MDKFFVKDPADCSTGELDRFLSRKNNTLNLNILKSDKIEIARQYLAHDNRTTIMFKKPSNLIGKIKYAFEKKMSKRYQTAQELDNFAIGSAISATAPSRVSSRGPQTVTHNQFPINSTRKATLPIFNPGSVKSPSETGSVITASINSERLRPTRIAPVIPPRPLKNQTVHRSVEFSPIEGDRGNTSHYFNDSSVPINRAKSEIPDRSKLPSVSNHQLISREYTRNTIIDDKIKYKFDTKFDTNTISIEDFLKALDRWRCANSASDEKTILMGLANFRNISLANNISETLTYEAMADFDTFCFEIKS